MRLEARKAHPPQIACNQALLLGVAHARDLQVGAIHRAAMMFRRVFLGPLDRAGNVALRLAQ